MPKFILLLLALSVSAGAWAQTTKVLFLGNSYTYTYNIPKKFKKLARSGGTKVMVRKQAKGGWKLADHLASEKTAKRITAKKWEYVVLQEQSAAAMSDVEATMYPAVTALESLIRANGSQTVLYLIMPQPYWDGAVLAYRSDTAVRYKHVFASFDQAQDSLQKVHTSIAGRLRVPVAPVGFAYAEALRNRPDLKLWKQDMVHPSKMGAYLAACVFYATIFGASPRNLSYRGGLTPKEAQFLQEIATKAVLTRKESWGVR